MSKTNLKPFTVRAGESRYPVFWNCTKSQLNEVLAGTSRVAVVSNPTVYALHGRAFEKEMIPARLNPVPILIGDGEKYKNQRTISRLYDQFFEIGLGRQDTIIALGGGVVGDTAGFAAATFKRGIKLIQAPTSILAMVDSSIGGKVGINHKQGKNQIGAFYQPQAIIARPEWLGTLGHREVIDGLGEIVKTGFLSSPRNLKQACLIEPDSPPQDNEQLLEMIRFSMKFKADVVAKDVSEAGMRAILNLGHTFAHAIEKVEGYNNYRHGAAVLAGLSGALYLSHSTGHLGLAERDEGLALLGPLTSHLKRLNFRPEDYLSPMAVDKKNRNGRLVFILLEAVGKPIITVVKSERKIIGAMNSMIQFVNDQVR